MRESGDLVLNDNIGRIQDIIGDSPVRFSYNPSPTLTHIERQLQAYEELYGDYPELVVIDNALDLSLIHISEPTRRERLSRMPSSA